MIATNQDDVGKRVTEITKGQGVPHALDAVGGAMGQMALEALGTRGRLLVYGTLSGEPIPVHPRADRRAKMRRRFLAFRVGGNATTLGHAKALS